MGPRPHLRFLHAKQRLLDPNSKSLWVPDLICGFCLQTATLALELLVSICPSPHLRFLHANQRLLDQNCMSLWAPDVTCDVLHSKQRAKHQNNDSLWGPALICSFCMQNSAFRTRITSLCGSKIPPVVFAFKTATSGPE